MTQQETREHHPVFTDHPSDAYCSCGLDWPCGTPTGDEPPDWFTGPAPVPTAEETPNG